jgi:2-(1,2-epoxy-1,2-dihydrophenyl)acetyl-CoA isomerase
MTITVSREGAVATVAFDRPQARNAFTLAMRAQFVSAFDELEANTSVRAVVLTGTGGAFSSGADIGEMGEVTPDAFLGRMRQLHAMARAVARFRAPVIAAVDGVCIGAAWGFAMASDIVLASDRVRFAATFRRIGYAPDAGLAWHFMRTINPMRAKEIVYSGREVHAEEALSLGLALEVLAPEALMPRAMELATMIAEGPATALHLTKRQFAAAPAQSLDAFLDFELTMQPLLGQTRDHRDAVDAFRQKRAPTFNAN